MPRNGGRFPLPAASRNFDSEAARGSSVMCLVMSRSEITSSTMAALIIRSRRAQPRESALKQKLLMLRGIPSVNCAMACSRFRRKQRSAGISGNAQTMLDVFAALRHRKR